MSLSSRWICLMEMDHHNHLLYTLSKLKFTQKGFSKSKMYCTHLRSLYMYIFCTAWHQRDGQLTSSLKTNFNQIKFYFQTSWRITRKITDAMPNSRQDKPLSEKLKAFFKVGSRSGFPDPRCYELQLSPETLDDLSPHQPVQTRLKTVR